MATLIEKYTTTSKKVNYGDFKTNMTVHPGSKDLQLSNDIDAVRQCIINIIKTQPYERPFQPKVGSLVGSLLFENITQQTITLAEQVIKDTISVHEPRARVESVTVSPTEAENGLYITIVFYILNSSAPITIDLVLDRVR